MRGRFFEAGWPTGDSATGEALGRDCGGHSGCWPTPGLAPRPLTASQLPRGRRGWRCSPEQTNGAMKSVWSLHAVRVDGDELLSRGWLAG
jgi:hypothetical protein